MIECILIASLFTTVSVFLDILQSRSRFCEAALVAQT